MFPSQNIEILKKDLQDNKAMALFLGTGTDISSIYPQGEHYDKLKEAVGKMTWDALLNELIGAACINSTERKALETINSNPLKAAILKNRMGESYIPVIQNWLYVRCNHKILMDSYPYFKKYKECPSVERLKNVPFGTLFVIADLILRQTSVKTVFTQNYNNFLTEAIRILLRENAKSYPEIRQHMKPIDVYAGWRDEPFDNDCFFVYHVHGYIPPPSEMIPSRESNHIVLSDEEFYQLSKDVYSWQNASQLHFLSHHTCIMIGLSLDDLTTLRLLRHANLERSSEKVYWLRGGPDDGDDMLLRLKSEYFESQHVCVVNDAEGYQDLYHQLLETLRNKELKNKQ